MYVREFLCIRVYSILFRKATGKGGRVGIDASSEPTWTMDPVSCAENPFKGLRVHKKFHRQLMFSEGHPSNCSSGKLFCCESRSVEVT
jgi:hypothetical protein